MRVLVACEYSGIVRDAFTAKGHDAMSCDLLPSDTRQCPILDRMGKTSYGQVDENDCHYLVLMNADKKR
ncbi:MAG: hypothetical protein CMF22_10330 [Idiomarinaceae bacterium]|nr:hypothetical protein [Idiomarinaceae bacterium]MBG23837.1 hypothetical protein [Idiomarinaceae bacterium]